MPDWLAVLLGGGAGALARYAVGHWASVRYPDALLSFPWHTFGINVVGSFVLGLVAVWCKERPTWFFLVGTGVCGGFTTFSTFSLETLELIQEGRPWTAAAYACGSVVAGVLGAWLALKLAGGRVV